MIERIRILLQTNQLTPTQFADTIGVARPIISHILSGRNKPSLEVVQKVIGAFPAISIPWLLSGVGDMLAADTPSMPVANPTLPNPAESASPIVPNASKAPRSAAKGPASRQLGGALRHAEQTLFADSSPVAPQQTSPTPTPSPALTPQDQSGAAATFVSAPVVAPALAAPVVPSAVAQQPAVPEHVPADISFASAFVEPGKGIRRIVIFYQDGTFTDYQPETKP